ncbi:hypothetical protein E8E14_014895 [Neopestalotiopsis sp. 37M]|nr:hypothetical protein E8E14_014895 [Neopestalotiopsis sp. 37M]
MSDKTGSPIAAKAASPAKKTELTTREVEVLAAAWVSLKTEADVDIDKIARLTGFQNPRSATNAMYAIKKKLSQIEAADEGFTGIAPTGAKGGRTATPKVATPKSAAAKETATPRSNKRKGAEDHAGTDADNEASEAPTPAPKKARATKKSSKLAQIAAEDDEDVDGADDDKTSVKEDDTDIKADEDHDSASGEV